MKGFQAVLFFYVSSIRDRVKKYKYNRITQTQMNDTIILPLLSRLKLFI